MMDKKLSYEKYLKLKEEEYINNHEYTFNMTEKERQSFIRIIRSKCDKYEISPVTYLKILEYQNYSCGICGKPREEFSRNFSLDHNHDCMNCDDEGTFREIRGLLCTNCNLLLGHAMDSIKLLRIAIDYLQNSSSDKFYAENSIPHLSDSDYNELLLAQNGKCKMCQMEQSRLNKKLFVDHDHKTGKVRGLLCWRCNSVLGHSRDDIRILTKAILYLRRNIWREINPEYFEGDNPFSDDYKKPYYEYLAEDGGIIRECEQCGDNFLDSEECENTLCQNCLKKKRVLEKEELKKRKVLEKKRVEKINARVSKEKKKSDVSPPKVLMERKHKIKETWDIVKTLKKKDYSKG
jgi:hypothetical protein